VHVPAAERRAGIHRSRVTVLVAVLAATLTAAAGITNKSLRTLMIGLPHAPYTPGQMTYDLRRLRLAGLIRRIERTNTYLLTPRHQVRRLLHQAPQRAAPPAHGRRPGTSTPSAPARLKTSSASTSMTKYISRARLGKAA